MKIILLSGVASLTLAACATTPADDTIAAPFASAPLSAAPVTVAPAAIPVPDNILLQPWGGGFGGVPPWDKVSPSMLPEALAFASAEYLREIDAIAGQAEAPTFANTIEALQRSGQRLDRVQTVFGVYTSNLSTDEVQAIDKEWSPKLSEVYDKATLNEALFLRVDNLYQRRAQLGLDDKQMRLLTRTWESYVRNGAKLDDAAKARLSAYNSELASLFAEFSSDLLADEATFIRATAAQMAGVPDDVKNAALAAAKEEGLPAGSYAIRNTRSAAEPVMKYARDRKLREQVFNKFVNRGDNGDANDTNATIAKIVKLRADRAHLLGYATHADWRMQDTMAKTPARAMELMMRVWPAAVARVREEVADMKPIAAKDGVRTIEPWDYRYYMEKVREAKYDLSEEEIKPYFQLDNLVKGMMWSAERLYDLKFVENTGAVPVFHPDVRTFAVSNSKTGEPVGLFYFDTYARTGKRSGAWMNAYRSRAGLLDDKIVLASNNNNFNKPSPGEPVLISRDDASTLFHEFGHAIHGFLVDVRYPSFAGSQRDFVEYPSQVNENWLLTRPVLDRFALHYKTGKPMPDSLLKKIEASDTFNQGFETVEYLSSALVDMKLHMKPDGVVDPDAFERQALAEIGMPREIVMRHRMPQFGHLFSSDSYSAGYYSYLWSETMDADTWAAFEEAGDPFDRATADRFRTIVLETGNATDRAEAYRQFRGRDPDVKALLRRRGFPVN